MFSFQSPLHIETPPDISEDMIALMSGLSYGSASNSPTVVLRANPLIGGDQQLTPNSMDSIMFMDTSEQQVMDEPSILIFSEGEQARSTDDQSSAKNRATSTDTYFLNLYNRFN